MASDDKDGFPWDAHTRSRKERPLTHRMSNISDISSLSSPPLPTHRDSIVSIQSPTGDWPPSSSEQGSSQFSAAQSPKISEPENKKQLESQSSSHHEVPRPKIVTSGDAQRRQNRTSLLPDTLKIGSPVSPASKGFNPFARLSGGSYEALSPSGSSSPKSTSNRKSWGAYAKRKSSILGKRAVSEDEIDMGLLGSAMPFASQKTSYSRVDGHDEGNEPDDTVGVGFDISSFEGPDLQKLHEQEAGGILTGGLGQGINPEVSIKSADLVASSPISPVALSRKGTFRSTRITGTPTLRDLGQHEANRRGEVVEVILEEEALPVDITSFAGNTALPGDKELESRKTFQSITTNPTFRSSKVEVFYPQANWKPFAMRWPYLSALIIISFTLAGAQEYLYQKSVKTPLYKFHKATDLKTGDYFVFRYLPTVVAVAFGILWQVTDFEVKRLEAYYQLAKDGGALASESINVDYITFFTLLRPILALRLRHYAVAISSIATLLAVSVVPTLLTASVILTPDRDERQKDPQGLKEVWIDAAFSRALSSILILIAILGCVLMWQVQRRRSGLINNVKGIAGIAAMANRSHILMDFKEMDTATPEVIHQRLKAHRYVLRNSSIAPDDNVPLTSQDKNRYDQHKRGSNPHPLMLRLSAGIPYILGMAAFSVLIPIILFTKANVVTDKAPWLLTVLAIIIKLIWGTLENDVRMMEPFYRLSLRHASPRVLTLDYTAMAFGWMPIRAFLNRHILVALVGIGSIFAEILTVCAATFGGVAGIDFAHPNANRPSKDHTAIDAGEETFVSFWVSFSLSIFILLYLCVVGCIVYARRRHSFLPRQPSTIASILAFIHQSRMLYDFVGTEKLNNDEMVKRLVGIKKTYGLGWFKGRDGEMHCGIDEEELIRDYSHGKDARHATTPWSSNWENYD